MSNIQKEIIIETSEEMNSAMKSKYGIIRIQGDLKDEIKDSFQIAAAKTGVAYVGLIISALPVFGQLLAVIIGTGSIATLIKNAKSWKYSFREDFAKGDEFCLVHDKIVDEVRKKYKSGDMLVAENMDAIFDMIYMKVNVIKISRSLLEDLYKIENSTRKEKKKMNSINEFNEYSGYKVISDFNNYRLVRKR